MKIVIIGTGGMAKEVWGLCTDSGAYKIIGFVSEKSTGEGVFMGLVILAADTEFLKAPRYHCVIANGHPGTRRKIVGMYMGSAHNFPNIIHPAAIVFCPRLRRWLYNEEHNGIRGITIMPGVVIQPDVTIDDFVHLNMNVSIGHDVTIGRYTVVNHGAGISGNVRIGEACLIGAGAIVIEGNTIGDGVTIGAGAVVTKNVPPNETWGGVPARRLDTKHTYAEPYGVT